jgi:Zinc-finger domain of monoamine-oxidase A repressor R1
MFNSNHLSWHCPHCRGICNCSICLRKAGFGYILDGSISEQLTGVQGRLSVAGHVKKHAPSGNATRTQSEEQTRVSVRAWLARKGVAVGTEDWMEERRRQGVRIVVGRSPPPTDGPSPYREARFNPTLAACTDCVDEEEDVDASLSARFSHDGGDNMISPGPPPCNHTDATGLPPIYNRQSLPPNGQPNPDTINGTTAAYCDEELGSHSFSLQPSDTDASALSSSAEDLPGLSSALTRGIKLITGKSLSGATGQKKQVATHKYMRKRAVKSKKQVEEDDSDYEELDQTTRRPLALPITRVRDGGLRDFGTPIKAIQDDPKEGGEQGFPRGSSTMSDTSQPPHRADGPSTPAPPHEPVLVPTEHYVPSKLDATMAKDSQLQVGPTYWSLNADTPRETEQKQDHGHGPSSLLMSTPLYSNNDRQLSPQFSLEDGTPVGPSLTESVSAVTNATGPHQPPESTSSSKSCTLDGYLNLQMHSHAHDDDAYLTSSLAAFTTLDETWAMIDMAPYPSIMDNDVSPLQT